MSGVAAATRSSERLLAALGDATAPTTDHPDAA
ncbi:hypothetical protein QFZ64_006316 [Streptomyces sp. B3I8]|nr:hypothetical protein [Streptomyces sp. B3I8]